jgi:hypothetical protein
MVIAKARLERGLRVAVHLCICASVLRAYMILSISLVAFSPLFLVNLRPKISHITSKKRLLLAVCLTLFGYLDFTLPYSLAAAFL